MNAHNKGYRNEKKARDLLESKGWITDIKNWNKWAGKDFYNAFDIVAVKNDRTKWIQVKSNMSDMYSARKKIKEWMIENHLKIEAEIWVKENRKDWRKFDILAKSEIIS